MWELGGELGGQLGGGQSGVWMSWRTRWTPGWTAGYVIDADISPASTAPEKYAPEAGEPDPQDEELWDALYTEASALLSFAADFDLKILGLQPLNQFDGWREGERADWVRAKAERWLMLCEKLEVQFLQVSGV